MKKQTILFILVLILGIGFGYFLFRGNVKVEPSKFSGMKAVIYKSPLCGCCENYTVYLKSNGFNVEVKEVSDEELEKLKTDLGISYDLMSCHTTLIDNYFTEGHIPLEAIEKLLTEKTKIKGIALPGMPSGSPGMSGVKLETWKIYQIKEDGKNEIFMEI